MDLLATLLRSGGIEGLARQSGLSSSAALAATEASLPVLVGGMRRYVHDHGGGRAGLARLLDLLGEPGGGGLAAQVMGSSPLSMVLGEDLLDRLFPDGDAEALLAATGANPRELEAFWPLLAMLLGGYISARVAASGDPRDLGAFADLLTGEGPDNGDLAEGVEQG